MFDKRIITIHDVSDNTMSLQRLEKIIEIALHLGYHFVSIGEILKEENKGRLLALTVDDAYKSSITTILPLLKRYNIKSTLFVPPGLLDLEADNSLLFSNDMYPGKDMMTWDDLSRWKEQGQDVGYHSCYHLDLYHHSDEEIIADFTQGMKLFSDRGFSPMYFAYPKGFLPKNRLLMETLLKKQGLEYAFTVNPGAVNSTNRYYISRTILGNKEKLFWSIFKILGLTDPYFYAAKQWVEQKI